MRVFAVSIYMYSTVATWPSNNGLRVGYLNINSAKNKIEDIASILDNNGNNFHLFCTAESRLTDAIPDSHVSLPNYNIIRLDCSRAVPKSTGLLLYCAKSVNYKRLTNLENFNVESIWVEIYVKHCKPVIIGFLYRNPAEKADWVDGFNLMMDAATFDSKELILFGDFNIDLLNPNKNWSIVYATQGLEQIIDRPTRVTKNTATLIDHVYVNTKSNINEVCSVPTGCSDHSSVCITWHKKGVKIPKTGHKEIYYRCFTHFNEDAFVNDLYNSSLDNVYQIRNADEAVDYWIGTFNSVYNKHAPFVKKRVKHSIKPPWINKEIDAACYKRDEFDRTNEKEFKELRNKVSSMKRKAKKKYYQNLICSSQNTKSIWKAINMLTNSHHKNQDTVKDISPEELNIHFANVATNIILNDKTNVNDLQKLQEFCQSKNIRSSFSIPFISVNDVLKLLLHSKPSRSRDLDDIDGNILKIAAYAIADSLTYIYNLCIEKQHFPKKFKLAKVIPLHKGGDRATPSNYRPISILSIISKPLEKNVQFHLNSHLIRYELLHESQSGFRKNHSCHTSLIQLIDKCLTNINNNEFTGVLFIDFAKAFDVINHSHLIKKLTLYNLSSESLNFISSFLTDRQQLVESNSKRSKPTPIQFGVPQGSVLGPLLFSIYINDLPLHLQCCSEMFADDTSLQANSSNSKELVATMQSNIDNLVDWTETNHMALNAQKTKCMYVTTRQKRQKLQSGFPPLYVKNEIVEEVSSHKVLGITIDKDLSWIDHLNDLRKRLSKRIFQLAKIKNFLDLHSRKLFFHGHILSLINYASTVWDNSSQSNLKQISSLHKKAIKLILLQANSLCEQDYKTLNILPLKDRLHFNKCLCMFNVVNGLAPQKIIRTFKSNEKRHTHKLLVPKPRNNLYKSSLTYSGACAWNNLPDFLKHCPSKLTFKHNMKKFLFDKL